MGADAGLLKAMGPELERLLPELDEKGRRLVLGAVARAAGDGGIGAVARMSGASWQTVADGAAELASGETARAGRVRRPGGGRKSLAESDPGLLPALLALVEDSTRGDPCSPLRWTTLSMRHLADELAAAGHACSPQTAWRLLQAQGYSMRANAKVIEGRQHPDRDAQFRYIAAQAREHLDAGQPVISVDAKKREQVGRYAQGGREWRPAGDPQKALSHDFPSSGSGHAIPYGVYDVGANAGFVNVGTDGNTGDLAVASVRRWWGLAGRAAYPGATRLMITPDAGGGSGPRNRAWKKGLAAFAQEEGLEVTTCHLPPGTSKWNKVEHRLFSQVTHAWRRRPLTSYDVIISTISAITTTTGLAVTAVLDPGAYPRGATITAAEARDTEQRCLTRHSFHGEWNYALLPVPRPAPPPPEAAAGRDPGWPRHALNQRALTGMGPADVDALAAATEHPARARRELELQLRLGHPGHPNGARRAHPHHDYVLAALILARLGTWKQDLAPALGMSPSQVGRNVPLIAKLIAATPHPDPDPPPATPARTYAQLHAYATSHGITGLPPAPAQPTLPHKPR